MNEFLKLKWKHTSDVSYLEQQACCFISDECLMGSYMYKPPLKKKSKVVTSTVNFVPGIQYRPKSKKKSSLNKMQQEHCLNAIMLLRQNKSPHELKMTEKLSLETFNKLRSKLLLENEQYTMNAKSTWENDKAYIAKLNNNLYHFGRICIRKKFKRYLDYKQYYKEKSLISMSYTESESMPEVNCIQNVLGLGIMAKFSHPSLKIACRLRGQSLPCIPCGLQTNSKLPVSEDENIRKLVEDKDINVVISSSGLSRILDMTDLKVKWFIPVKVEQIITPNGVVKKIVFIDKPLVQKHPDPLDLKYYSMKRLVKTNLCQYEAFRFDNQDNFPTKQKSKNPVDDQDAEEMDREQMPWRRKQKGEPNVIHHNVNYRIWNFKTVDNSTLLKTSMKNTEINLLVRSKLDACEEVKSSGVLQPVIVKPKIELQLHHGANIATKSELSREWTSLFFRPYSTLYRVRMHWNTAEVVSIENCTIQKVTSEANSLYQYNPYLGLERLNHLMKELVDLKVGNYMLVHLPKYESFVGIWSECDSDSAALNMRDEYIGCKIDDEIRRNWVPLDLNYILPIHEYLKAPPGCFPPPLMKKVNNWKKTNGADKKNKGAVKKKNEAADGNNGAGAQ